MNELIKDLGNGYFEVKGLKMSLQDLMSLGARQVKSQDEMIERAIQQEYSRAKTKHYNTEYARIVQSNQDLLKQVNRFNLSSEDFREIAEKKISKSIN